MAQPLNANQGKSGPGPLDARALVAFAKAERDRERRGSEIETLSRAIRAAIRCMVNAESTQWGNGGWTFRFDFNAGAFTLTKCDGSIHPLVEQYLLETLDAAGFEVTKLKKLKTYLAEVPKEAA
jgi:hypothetical protein